nr:glycosyltransferase [Sphingomonas lycopersici]
MFSRSAWWKRELGFRAQIASSAAILLSSHDSERDCLSWYPSARGRTHVARFAVPLDDWPDADTAWSRLRAADIPEDFVFLPNQLWQHKNHLLAIDAAALLTQRGLRRPILATGHGEDPRRPGYRDVLAERIVEVGAQDSFRLIGNVDHGLVRALMVGTNALLNPSRFEGWSTTVEEAKAVGTPLILSDLSVHREQAPGATFFGIDDAGALASAIAAAPPRPLAQIRAAVAAARDETARRQRAFAEALNTAIFAAAHTGKGNYPA